MRVPSDRPPVAVEEVRVLRQAAAGNAAEAERLRECLDAVRDALIVVLERDRDHETVRQLLEGWSSR